MKRETAIQTNQIAERHYLSYKNAPPPLPIPPPVQLNVEVD